MTLARVGLNLLCQKQDKIMAVPSNRPIEVVVAEKNPLLQSSLTQVFEDDDRFRLVAVTADGERFLEAIERIPFDVGVIGWEIIFSIILCGRKN